MPKLRREFEKLTEPQIRGVLKSLRAALKRMREIMGGAPPRPGVDEPTDFDVFAARQKTQALESEIVALDKELKIRLGTVFRDGAKVADDLNADAPANLIGIDANIAARAESEAARMITKNVTERMRRDINRATVDAVSGQTDLAGFERSVAKALDVDAMDARVERITRTELGEVFEQQGAEADARLAEQGADLIKVWSHKCGGRSCRGARPEHVAIHGQERELWETFNVGGGAKATTPPNSGVGHEANRPLDPSLPPGERINCGCTVVRRPRSSAKQSYIAKVNPRDSSTISTVAVDNRGGTSRLAASTPSGQPDTGFHAQ